MPARKKSKPAYFEVWNLHVNQPEHRRAFWLRIAVFTSENLFRKQAEVWAALSERDASGEMSNTVVKQTLPLEQLAFADDYELTLGNVTLSSRGSKGSVQSKGEEISWDLRFEPSPSLEVSLVNLGFLKNKAETLEARILFTGSVSSRGKKLAFDGGLGSLTHWSGRRNFESWTWAYCSQFENAAGKPEPAVLECLQSRTRIVGSFLMPTMTACYFFYRNQAYLFTSLKDSFRIKEERTLTEWNLEATKGPLSFRVQMSYGLKDFVGLTYEDTNGTLLFSCGARLVTAKLLVYRDGKLENALTGQNSASYEVTSRSKNPYIHIHI